MANIQSVFFLVVAIVLLYLVIDALLTGSIWIKGARTGFINTKQLAHKRNREEEPSSYWGFFIFYLLALFFMIYKIFN